MTSQSVAGSAISFGYDNDGLLTTAGALTLSRNAGHGLVEGTTLSTGTAVTTSHGYSSFGELSGESASIGGAGVYSASYGSRDKLGRIVQRSETVQGQSRGYAYGYDAAGRLDTVHVDGVLVSDYGYDANGNRTGAVVPAQGQVCGSGSVSGSYDGQDRLTAWGNCTYTYTANGELLSRTVGGATTSYGYDVLGNLRSVSLPGGVSLEYVIDGRNRRVGKKVDGVLTQGFLYGNQLEPVAELDGTGVLVSRFVYASKAHSPDYLVKGAYSANVGPRFRPMSGRHSGTWRSSGERDGSIVTD